MKASKFITARLGDLSTLEHILVILKHSYFHQRIINTIAKDISKTPPEIQMPKPTQNQSPIFKNIHSDWPRGKLLVNSGVKGT